MSGPLKRIVHRTYLFVLPLVTIMLVGCGRGSAQGDDIDPAKAVVRENGVAKVHITGNDLMRYNITRFLVHPGEKVMLILENIGRMPIVTMGHDLVILKKGEDYKRFAAEAEADRGPKIKGSVPEDMQDRVLAHTKLLGPGEKDTIEFIAPEAGEYPYLCTFPTHFVFMNGVMIVQ